ncbi:DNA-binding GntR family transcriptional regulator [Nocardiopsis mwathae]|uniref:DNA-binding GntR family transcriptional regulator n=1 Tax=Nocardiopsis mwathae TaxID=1472723 RepID=A0A7W9YNP9_9ACTN|nr:GntR family transcriptional regulator [Nocardiopsis mwathae]MBB6174446.1 DNA-binding GntR family transcriptional regulator [Nocardiopsis mwathae]
MEFGPDDDIEPDAPTPPYKQLAGILKARIRRGDWKPNRPIASEARLVDEFGLSRPTVRRAIRVLVDEGVLFVVPQRGTYVAEHPDSA